MKKDLMRFISATLASLPVKKWTSKEKGRFTILSKKISAKTAPLSAAIPGGAILKLLQQAKGESREYETVISALRQLGDDSWPDRVQKWSGGEACAVGLWAVLFSGEILDVGDVSESRAIPSLDCWIVFSPERWRQHIHEEDLFLWTHKMASAHPELVRVGHPGEAYNLHRMRDSEMGDVKGQHLVVGTRRRNSKGEIFAVVAGDEDVYDSFPMLGLCHRDGHAILLADVMIKEVADEAEQAVYQAALHADPLTTPEGGQSVLVKLQLEAAMDAAEQARDDAQEQAASTMPFEEVFSDPADVPLGETSEGADDPPEEKEVEEKEKPVIFAENGMIRGFYASRVRESLEKAYGSFEYGAEKRANRFLAQQALTQQFGELFAAEVGDSFTAKDTRFFPRSLSGEALRKLFEKASGAIVRGYTGGRRFFEPASEEDKETVQHLVAFLGLHAAASTAFAVDAEGNPLDASFYMPNGQVEAAFEVLEDRSQRGDVAPDAVPLVAKWLKKMRSNPTEIWQALTRRHPAALEADPGCVKAQAIRSTVEVVTEAGGKYRMLPALNTAGEWVLHPDSHPNYKTFFSRWIGELFSMEKDGESNEMVLPYSKSSAKLKELRGWLLSQVIRQIENGGDSFDEAALILSTPRAMKRVGRGKAHPNLGHALIYGSRAIGETTGVLMVLGGMTVMETIVGAIGGIEEIGRFSYYSIRAALSPKERETWKEGAKIALGASKRAVMQVFSIPALIAVFGAAGVSATASVIPGPIRRPIAGVVRLGGRAVRAVARLAVGKVEGSNSVQSKVFSRTRKETVGDIASGLVEAGKSLVSAGARALNAVKSPIQSAKKLGGWVADQARLVRGWFGRTYDAISSWFKS